MAVRAEARGLLAALFVATIATRGRAQEAEAFEYPKPDRDESKETFGMAEFGVGFLVLPTAEVCVERAEAGCSKGDQSLAVSAWPMFRMRQFAVGAGVMYALTPTTDAPRNDSPDLPRDHSRSYFTVELAGRYYIPLNETLDGWLGVTTGLVVVNDTFQTQKGLTEKALVGPRGVTILTEGATVGAAAGLAFTLAENWLLGGYVRGSNWFLPSEPAKDPIGDEASLDGRVFTIDLGVTIAYRSRFLF